jgi:hypothetical protein
VIVLGPGVEVIVLGPGVEGELVALTISPLK